MTRGDKLYLGFLLALLIGFSLSFGLAVHRLHGQERAAGVEAAR